MSGNLCRSTSCIPIVEVVLEPHLTVVQVADERQFDRIAGEFARPAQGKLPIRAIVREISLMTGREGIWVVHTNFALGEGDCP